MDRRPPGRSINRGESIHPWLIAATAAAQPVRSCRREPVAVGVGEQRAGDDRLATASRRAREEIAPLFDFMRERRIVRSNRRLEEIFGYPPGGLEGLSTRVWYPDDASFARVGDEVWVTGTLGDAALADQQAFSSAGGRSVTAPATSNLTGFSSRQPGAACPRWR